MSTPETIALNRAQRRAMEKASRRPPKPKRADSVDAVGFAIRRAQRAIQPVSADQARDLAIAYHGALNAISQGTGNAEDANTLALAANIALMLVEAGLGIDQLPTVHAAQDAIINMMRREQRTGRFGLTGPELRHLQDLLDLHDAQIADPDCTEAVMCAALDECKRRRDAGRVLGLS
ncbi:MAG: hypothetical protein ACT6S0_04775 [Roseateles sp.]|uniref:hypothetical protein n=1 Tax=Roseateles sp. TaxID=1971397 RepID=UPI0040351423